MRNLASLFLLAASSFALALPATSQGITPDAGTLAAAARDRTVKADLDELTKTSSEAMGLLLGATTAGGQAQIRFIGKGRVQRGPGEEPEADDRPQDSKREKTDAFRAFNPATRNEFEISLPESARNQIGQAALTRGLNRGSPARGGNPKGDPEQLEKEIPTDGKTPGRSGAQEDTGTFQDALYRGEPLFQKLVSWSNNIDNRQRFSSLSAATTSWPWRTISDLSGCTGTLIGPRHMITAGHCIYSRKNSAWNSFTARPGRAGGNWAYGQSSVPHASAFSWYFTPAGFRQASPAGGTGQYDIGIVVLGDRLGDQTGWMGYWHAPDAYLSGRAIYNRGFPVCNGTSNGVPRTDDPGDPGSSVVCVGSHLYGDPNTCKVGDFAVVDGQGWSRRFKHSCDASAAQSGSPLYFYQDGSPVVTAVHTTSSCGKTAASAVCTNADVRPLTATRVTKEYSDWIAYFRSWKP
jgi:V8-like Glu-specific endopeptidase